MGWQEVGRQNTERYYGRLNLGSVRLKEGAPGGVQRAMLRPEWWPGFR